jgi:hypothetical protein
MKLALLLLSIALTIASCAPTVTRSTFLKKDITFRRIAVLPITASAGLSAKKIADVADAFDSQLKGLGYLVLDREIVSEICSTTACPERETLRTRYDLDGIFSLSLASFQRNNLIAGYLNIISGTLTAYGDDAQNLLTIEHTIYERGGILFNSGQVFEGVKGTINFIRGRAPSPLAERFVREIITELPATQSNQAPTLPLELSAVTATAEGNDRLRICVKSQPNLRLMLISKGDDPQLREVSHGLYCGIFLSSSLTQRQQKLTIEARSAFGQTEKSELDVTRFLPCSPEGLIQRSLQGSVVTALCPTARIDHATCEQQLKLCEGSEILLFIFDPLLNRYAKLGTLTRHTPVRVPPATPLAVIAISPHGTQSPPFILEAD